MLMSWAAPFFKGVVDDPASSRISISTEAPEAAFGGAAFFFGVFVAIALPSKEDMAGATTTALADPDCCGPLAALAFNLSRSFAQWSASCFSVFTPGRKRERNTSGNDNMYMESLTKEGLAKWEVLPCKALARVI
jgi:hypothetical protein